MGVLIKEVTYNYLNEHMNENSIVILPIGGGAKEHGSHLPMGTDYFVTDWLANQVTKRCDVFTLPTLAYAYFPAFTSWKGSVSIQANHFINFVEDIILSYALFGVRKFMILDGGVSTQLPLKILSHRLNNNKGIKVAISDITALAVDVEEEICQQDRGGHGDESETSTLLYIREELVQMDKAVEEYQPSVPGTVYKGIRRIFFPSQMATESGINGDSRLATKEKGKLILEAMLTSIENFLNAFNKIEIEE